MCTSPTGYFARCGSGEVVDRSLASSTRTLQSLELDHFSGSSAVRVPRMTLGFFSVASLRRSAVRAMFFFLFRALTRFEALESEGAEVWKEEKAAMRDPNERL